MEDLKAVKIVADYYNYKIDMETMYDLLYKHFGSYKQAVTWLADNGDKIKKQLNFEFMKNYYKQHGGEELQLLTFEDFKKQAIIPNKDIYKHYGFTTEDDYIILWRNYIDANGIKQATKVDYEALND